MKWPRVSLLDALANAEEFVDGDWVESKDQDPEGDVRLVQLADVGDGEYIDKSARFLTSAKARALKCTFLKPGDVMVARMPDPLGRACIFPGDSKPSVTVVDVCIIRPNPREHDSRWLMRCLNAPDCRNQIAGYATGTTRSRISRGNLGKIRIPLPPLAEQQRIAEVLDRAETLRAKRRAALAQLDSLTQSLFLDLFGDPRVNERRWAMAPFESFISDMRGGAALEPEDFVEAGFPILHKGAIKAHGEISLDSKKKTFATLAYAEANRNNVVNRDFVAVTLRDLVPTGPSIGLTADLESGPSDEYLLAQGAYGFRPDVSKVLPEYLVHLSNNENFRHVLRQNAVGSTQIHIRTPIYLAINIPLPPVDVQREFARRVNTLEKVKTAQRASLSEFDSLFTTLQYLSFNGEI